MNVGMLWFDSDPRNALEAKVARAADYYRAKYGSRPTLCFVHPSMLPSASSVSTPAAAEAPRLVAAGVELRSNRSVLPHHFWIGMR